MVIRHSNQLSRLGVRSMKKDVSYLSGKGANDPLVSIIIPCFNDGGFLPECLQSLYTQNYHNIEAIVVDDCSTDQKTLKSLNALSGRVLKRNKITVIHNNKNIGIGASRNIGIKAAKGTFIVPLDVDDKISANFIRDSLTEILKEKHHIIRTRVRTFGDRHDKFDNITYDFEELKYKNLAYTTCMFRKRDWDEIGGYKEDMLSGFEDWEFWINMGKHNHFMSDCPASVFWKRIREDSFINNKGDKKVGFEQIQNYHPELYSKTKKTKKIFLQEPPIIEENATIVTENNIVSNKDIVEKDIKVVEVIPERIPKLPINIIIFTHNSLEPELKSCLQSLKKTTSNIKYELHILNYGNNKQFSIPEKINEFLEKNEGYLIVCNDSVIFSSGWLDHALDCIEQREDIGILTFQINGLNKKTFSNGVEFDGKELYTQKEFKIDHPANIPSQLLGCFLIPPTKIQMNSQYKQFFFDVDFCWTMWKNKKKVVMLPDIIFDSNKNLLPNENFLNNDENFCSDLMLFKSEWGKKYLVLIKEISPQLLDKFNEFGKRIRCGIKRIVYTVCTGNYDTINPPKFLEPNTRYIAFSDNNKIEGWEIIPWSGGRRESREPKILPHKYLPKHDESLYIDACIRLTKPPSELFKLLKSDFAACAHPNDKTVLMHSKTLIKGNYDDTDIIEEQIKKYKRNGFKDDSTLTENSLILRRNTKECKKLNEFWWKEYCSGCNRDQMSLPYAFFKAKMKPQILGFRSRTNVYYDGWWNHNWRKERDPKKREFLYKKKPMINNSKILMATVVNGEKFEELFSYIEPFHIDYAKRFGFDYKVITTPQREWPSPSWWKLELIEDLEKYDAVFFCDADALPKLNAPNIMKVLPRDKFSALNSLKIPYMRDEKGATVLSWRKWLMATKKPMDLYIPKKMGFYINGGIWVCYKAAKSILECDKPVEIDGFLEQHQLCWNLYKNPKLFSEFDHCWNFGHPSNNLSKMKYDSNFILHLNSPDIDKVELIKEMLTWPCFRKK